MWGIEKMMILPPARYRELMRIVGGPSPSPTIIPFTGDADDIKDLSDKVWVGTHLLDGYGLTHAMMYGNKKKTTENVLIGYNKNKDIFVTSFKKKADAIPWVKQFIDMLDDELAKTEHFTVTITHKSKESIQVPMEIAQKSRNLIRLLSDEDTFISLWRCDENGDPDDRRIFNGTDIDEAIKAFQCSDKKIIDGDRQKVNVVTEDNFPCKDEYMSLQPKESKYYIYKTAGSPEFCVVNGETEDRPIDIEASIMNPTPTAGKAYPLGFKPSLNSPAGFWSPPENQWVMPRLVMSSFGKPEVIAIGLPSKLANKTIGVAMYRAMTAYYP